MVRFSPMSVRLRQLEGPQGVGKTTASMHAEAIGFKYQRGIPTGDRLVANTEAQNWKESLEIMEAIVASREDTATDRSLWSLVAYSMRNKPQSADFFYETGSKLFRKRLDGADYRIIIVYSAADICLQRANPDSPVSIKSVEEANSEIEAYSELLERLGADGYEVYSICNTGISREEFLSQVRELLE